MDKTLDEAIAEAWPDEERAEAEDAAPLTLEEAAALLGGGL